MPKKLTKFAIISGSLVLALAGCLPGSGGSEDSPEQQDVEESAETEDSTPDSDTDEAREQMDEAAGPEADDITVDDTMTVIASREAAFSEKEVSLDLNQVSVAGEVMSVLFTVTNVGDKKWQIASDLDSGEFSISLSGSDADGEEENDDDLEDIKGGTTDGVTVTDTAN